MESINILDDNGSNVMKIEFIGEEARKYFLQFVKLYNKGYEKLIKVLEGD